MDETKQQILVLLSEQLILLDGILHNTYYRAELEVRVRRLISITRELKVLATQFMNNDLTDKDFEDMIARAKQAQDIILVRHIRELNQFLDRQSKELEVVQKALETALKAKETPLQISKSI